MIEQQYQLQILYGNDWQDVEKFDDRDHGLKALRVLRENGSCSDTRLLECSFDKDETGLSPPEKSNPGLARIKLRQKASTEMKIHQRVTMMTMIRKPSSVQLWER